MGGMVFLMPDSDYRRGIAYRYLQETKHSLGTPLSDHLGPLKRPSSLKTYPHAAKISLPDPDFSTANIWECLAKRRSLRDYKPEPLSLKELSSLLWATQGKTFTSAHSFYRAAPSAGALYPIETYIVINHVKEIEKGIYHLDVAGFQLETLALGSFSEEITKAALGQSMVKKAAVIFVWTAVILRSMWKYRNRAVRYIFMDAGHICQNLQLAATALDIGSCPIGAFYDTQVNSLIQIDGKEETALYLATVGKI